jgi:hypothetical protein
MTRLDAEHGHAEIGRLRHSCRRQDEQPRLFARVEGRIEQPLDTVREAVVELAVNDVVEKRGQGLARVGAAAEFEDVGGAVVAALPMIHRVMDEGRQTFDLRHGDLDPEFLEGIGEQVDEPVDGRCGHGLVAPGAPFPCGRPALLPGHRPDARAGAERTKAADSVESAASRCFAGPVGHPRPELPPSGGGAP